jgi:hypothetical protein
MSVWKWTFTDAAGDRISLVLQHNIKDEDEKQGNSIKMTLYDAMEEAQACYQKKHPDDSTPNTRNARRLMDWSRLIPH